MRTYEYKLSDMEQVHNVPDGFFSNENAILDIKLGNDISRHWQYEKGKVVCIGYLYQEMIKIFIADSYNDIDFIAKVNMELDKLKSFAKPRSFNKAMETGSIKGTFDYDIVMEEVRPFSGKGWNKDKFVQTLIENNIIQEVIITDTLDGDELNSVPLWLKFQTEHDQDAMMKVVSGLLCCLLKESLINKHRKYFFDNYKTNDRGWLI